MANALKDSPIKAVQVEALVRRLCLHMRTPPAAPLTVVQVVMKLVNHASKAFPTIATGSIVGMESSKQPGLLEITSCFPFPTIDAPATDSHQDRDSAANFAAAAPRNKVNIAYQNEMIKFLREVNVDANNVGWYTSTSMGNFVNLNTIENQYFYQKEPNERAVALVHDVSRSSQGALNLRAYRLSPSFVAAFKEGKFTTERYAHTSWRRQGND